MQVWDAVTGAKHHTFDGHEAPVYSICPHHKESIQVNDSFTILMLGIVISQLLCWPITLPLYS